MGGKQAKKIQELTKLTEGVIDRQKINGFLTRQLH